MASSSSSSSPPSLRFTLGGRGGGEEDPFLGAKRGNAPTHSFPSWAQAGFERPKKVELPTLWADGGEGGNISPMRGTLATSAHPLLGRGDSSEGGGRTANGERPPKVAMGGAKKEGGRRGAQGRGERRADMR